MKVYHMIIERKSPKDFDKPDRKEYLSKHQGAAPEGWRCVGVCGYHEISKKEYLEQEE